ncbi:MAG: FxSxx-COOH system tetratricopeptide repeat protein [Candidatus Thiodiazotropha endolucinida]|nr:FxSxx-COOH system tetratricopeptide repeat protein [Candidatus Thiodiazotropha endolucinida]
MGDTFNLSGDYRDGVQYIKCTFQLPHDEQNQFKESLDKANDMLATLPIDTIPEVSPLPVGSRLPFRHNPLFVGREQNIKALARIMVEGGVAAVGQLVAAMGLGGIGKTQLASEFCHRYGCYFAGGVFWMSFADPEEIPTEIARCGGLDGMNLAENFDNQPLEEQLQMVLTHWHSPLPRLLVFDNCEDPTLIARWRPRTGGCRIIITSRRDRWDPTLGIHHLALDMLTPKESCALLAEYRPDLQDNPHLEAIAEALGHLPLALHLAGSYLGRYPHSSLGDPAYYLEKLQDPALLAHSSLTSSDGHSPTEHEQHVGRTFALSWDQLDPEDTTDTIALNLLSEAAVLAPGEPIPRLLLLAISQPEQPDEDFLIAQAEALQRILSLGLLQSEADGSLVMHRLVGMFVRQQTDDWEVTCERVETHFRNQANEINEQGLPAPLLPWRAHLKHLAEQAETRGSEAASKLWNNWGCHLNMVADYTKARTAFERTVAIEEATLGPDHLNVATPVNNLGFVLTKLGFLEEAREAYERALAIKEAAFGTDHPEVALCISNLGSVHQDLGDLAEARKAYMRALAIDEVALGADHPSVASDVNNLGFVLHNLGDLAGARKALERALAIYEATFEPDHPHIASSINNLGSVLRDLGDLEGAHAVLKRALAINESCFGPDHPNVATDINNLGMVLLELGDLAGARAAFERSLAIDEATFGPDHPSVASAVNNLGAVLLELGDLAASHTAFERALAIYETTLGFDHPDVATVYNNLGKMLKTLGDLPGARAAFERALDIFQQSFGVNHHNTITVSGHLASLDETE